VDIQARHRLTRRQRDRQLQLCVPLVFMNGPSYRPNKRPGRAATNTKQGSE